VRVRHLALLVCVAGCGDGATSVPDAAPDAADLPDAAPRDGGASLPFVDFAASGCESFDSVAVVCRGTAPLDLRFAAIATGPLEAYLWSFGDGSAPDTTPAPAHRYATPGSYGVRLTVGGPGGTAQASRDAYVLVDAATVGDRCQADEQCAAGLTCLCDGGGCPAPLAAGLCTKTCGSCGTDQVCAVLGDGPDAWQGSYCLRSCTVSADCAVGGCQWLRADAGGWTKACLPQGLLVDDGEACNGDDGACSSGSCDDLGARGVCAASCDGAPCPSYAVCATFSGNLKRCLAVCTPSRPCTADPWLGCEAADSSGSLGFSVAMPGEQYCAPRRCTMPDDCGPEGTCQSGFCGAN